MLVINVCIALTSKGDKCGLYSKHLIKMNSIAYCKVFAHQIWGHFEYNNSMNGYAYQNR